MRREYMCFEPCTLRTDYMLQLSAHCVPRTGDASVFLLHRQVWGIVTDYSLVFVI